MRIDIISDAKELRLLNNFDLSAIHQNQSLPCYNPTTSNPLSHVPNVVPSRPSCFVPLDLATPGREQCHHRSIRQIWSLLDARTFVARAAEDQAVRSHYC